MNHVDYYSAFGRTNELILGPQRLVPGERKKFGIWKISSILFQDDPKIDGPIFDTIAKSEVDDAARRGHHEYVCKPTYEKVRISHSSKEQYNVKTNTYTSGGVAVSQKEIRRTIIREL